MLPVGTNFVFKLGRPLDDFQQEAIKGLPGAFVITRRLVRAPANLAWLVHAELSRLGIPTRYELDRKYRPPHTVPRDAAAAEALLLRSELRPGIWDGSQPGVGGRKYLPFQKEEILFALQAGSGMLWWKPGAGKTAGAIAWAVGHPGTGAIVTVTKAAVRRQWAREIGYWTTLVPWMSDPSARRLADWQDPAAYLTWCFLVGQRPWFIVSWEELADLIFGDKAYMLEGAREEADLVREPESEQVRSERAFCRIPGVGPATAANLLQHFGDLRTLQEFGRVQGTPALRTELLRVRGVGAVTADAICSVYRRIKADPPLLQMQAAFPNLQIDSVIFDEIHLAANRLRAKFLLGEGDADKPVRHSLRNRSAAAEWVSRRAKRRLGTTATPIPNRVRDLWGQIDLVHPWGMGSYWKFAIRYAGAHQGDFGMQDEGASRLEELTYRLGLTDAEGAPYKNERGEVVGVRGEWAFVSQIPKYVSHGQLPPMRREVRRIDPMLLTSGDSEAHKASRAETDPALKVERAVQWACSTKRPVAVDEVVDRVLAGEKVLVLSGRHEDVERTHAAIEARLRREWCSKLRAQGQVEAAHHLETRQGDAFRFGVPGVWWNHGGCGDSARDLTVRSYMSWVSKPGCCVGPTDHVFGDAEAVLSEHARLGGVVACPGMGAVLVATGDSIGTGVDLHDSDTEIQVMLPITPQEVEQREGRVMRQGQLRAVLIIYFVAEGTIDEHVAELLIDKLPAAAQVTGQAELLEIADAVEGVDDEDAMIARLVERMRTGAIGDDDEFDDD